MSSKKIPHRVMVIGGNIVELLKLQFQLYLHELAQVRKNFLIFALLCAVAIVLLLSSVAMVLVAIVWGLTQYGFSLAAALLMTSAGVFVMLTAMVYYAVSILRNQVRRLAVPKEELKANFACIRDQFLRRD